MVGRRLRFLAVLLLVVGLAGCGGGDVVKPDPAPAHVTFEGWADLVFRPDTTAGGVWLPAAWVAYGRVVSDGGLPALEVYGAVGTRYGWFLLDGGGSVTSVGVLRPGERATFAALAETGSYPPVESVSFSWTQARGW